MSNSYIILSNSTGTLTKRFKATAMKTPWVRTDNIELALDGTPDKSAGVILYPLQYILRVPMLVTDSNYGTMADLKTFFELNNPNDSPSDVITLTDHYGVAHDVIFRGEASPDPVSVIIDGSEAKFNVSVAFQQIQGAGQGSGSGSGS